MNTQLLLKSGYSLANIQEMILLFQNNLDKFKSVMKEGNEEEILSFVHKIKGGLQILQFSKLAIELDKYDYTNNNLSFQEYNSYLIKFTKQCDLALSDALFEISETVKKD